jgi:hypothetical protein
VRFNIAGVDHKSLILLLRTSFSAWIVSRISANSRSASSDAGVPLASVSQDEEWR